MASRIEKSFSFLDLPSEIRNKVYQYSLVATHTKTIKIYEERRVSYNFQTSIMGVSRQVKAEAEHIFRNDNLFMLIRPNFLFSSVYCRIKPFILARNEVARAFKHYTIKINIDISNELTTQPGFRGSGPPRPFMIAGEDLPWLVRTLNIVNGEGKYHDFAFLQHCSLSISAVGPSESAVSSIGGRSCLDYQRLSKLLKPLHHLRDINKARLDANVSAEDKHRILEGIHKPSLDMEVSIDKASLFMGRGDEYFRCGRHLQAIYAYQEALDYLCAFYDMYTWALRPQSITTETLAELFSNLFNRQRAARIRLEIGRKALDLTRFAQSGEDVLDKSARAGVDYAIDQYSNPRSSGVKNTQFVPTFLRLATQLEIIQDFESDPRLKKALIKALVAIMKDGGKESCYMKQWTYGDWDHWFLEI